jgi:hypothetical protein
MLECRLARPIGWVTVLNVHWDGQCVECPSHLAVREVERGLGDLPDENLDIANWADRSVWPSACKYCGALVPERGAAVDINVVRSRLWDTPSGDLEPGCIFHATDLTPSRWNSKGFSRQYWERCKRAGKILDPLAVVCPDGSRWYIDLRASNGATGADGLTDGWTVEGEPPRITCSPSINTGTYHGWLRDGVFRDPV